VNEAPRTGHWRYDGNVRCEVRISRCSVWPGSGDHEDPPELKEDREIECYALEFQTPVGTPAWVGGGYYASEKDASDAAEMRLGESLRWDT
jgi:hypothetical protein